MIVTITTRIKNAVILGFIATSPGYYPGEVLGYTSRWTQAAALR